MLVSNKHSGAVDKKNSLNIAGFINNDESTQNRVLLVDDSVFNLIAVKGLFRQFGLECDTAIDGS